MKRLILLALLCLGVSACTTVREIPVERIKTEYVSKNILKVDTFLEKDSIFVKEKGDTVWLERWKTRREVSFRDRTDTIFRTDTITITVKVPAELSWKQKVKQDTWWVLLVIAGIGVAFIWKRIRSKIF